MQTSLFNDLLVSCGNAIELSSAIVFDCIVNGKKLKAKLTHLEKTSAHFVYYISFSDGYTASFVAPVEGRKWYHEQLTSPYAKAIADDLNAFCGFHPTKPPICIRLKNKEEAFNLWVVPYYSRTNYFSVFYKGEHRFDLRKTERWEANAVGRNIVVNQEIAAIVCSNIEQRTFQSPNTMRHHASL